MSLLADGFSSRVRPVLKGRAGGIAAAHPLAVAAGQEMLFAGGGAVDALIAAQAVLCVVSPDACGLGGDVLALIHDPSSGTTAVNGAGAAPMGLIEAAADGASSVTVPGIVDGWACMHRRWGRLPLARLLEPAVRIARGGFAVPPVLARTVTTHRERLLRGGAARWSLLAARAGEPFVQPELAELLQAIGEQGAEAFYRGPAAAAIEAAVRLGGGTLTRADLADHVTPCVPALDIQFGDVRVAVQPPMTQGVLLAMALQGLEKLDLGSLDGARIDHACIELTEAAFMYRARAADGVALLGVKLPIDLTLRAAAARAPIYIPREWQRPMRRDWSLPLWSVCSMISAPVCTCPNWESR